MFAGLYYVILFLEIFDWLSDVFFISFDLADPRLEAGSIITKGQWRTP